LIAKKVLLPAATRAYHQRVIQKAENSNGKNSRTAEQRATEEADDVVVCSVTVPICGPGRHFQVDWRIGKTARSTRTEIIEAVADNTIRFQPNEVLAFGRDVSCRREVAVRCKTALCLVSESWPALGGWPLVSPTRGTAASMMKTDCRRKITTALSLAPGQSSNRWSSRNYFLPCSSRWAFTASSACPLP
jgi:hypothetical protein